MVPKRKRLRQTIERDLTYCKLISIFRYRCTVSAYTLFWFKHLLEKINRSGIIYRYMCSNYKVTLCQVNCYCVKICGQLSQLIIFAKTKFYIWWFGRV